MPFRAHRLIACDLGEDVDRKKLYMNTHALSLDEWVLHLEQGDDDSIASLAPEYVSAKGLSGESSFLFASNKHAFRALKYLLTAAEGALQQEELEKILYTVISEADNSLAFACFRTALEMVIKHAGENNIALYSHTSIDMALSIAKTCNNYRALLYIASILNDVSIISRCSCCCPGTSNDESATYSMEERHFNDSEDLSNIIEELEQAREASTPITCHLSLISNILFFLQSITIEQSISIVSLRVEEAIHKLKQHNIPDIPGAIILYTALYSIQDLYKQNNPEINQVVAADAIVGQHQFVDILYQSESLRDQALSPSHSESFINKHTDSKGVSFYIKYLNEKIYNYESEILKLQKRLETIRYRHREEAKINGKLNTALSEQLRDEIERSVMLEKQSSEKDEVILSLRELLKAWIRNSNALQNDTNSGTNCELYQGNRELQQYNDDKAKPLSTGINAQLLPSLIESATLTEKYIESMMNNLADVSDLLRRLGNERQSLSMIQGHVIGLEYEQEQICDSRADIGTEMLEIELRHYRRLYFSLKAHYEAMVNLLPEDAADLANDVLSNLIAESNEKRLECSNSSQDRDDESNDELKPSDQLFIDCESAWNEKNSAWRKYMTDREYQRYVERAVALTGLSTLFQHQTTSEPDTRSAKIRPWSAVLHGEKKERYRNASKSFY